MTDQSVPGLWWLLRAWRETTGYMPSTVAAEINSRLASELHYRVTEHAVRSWERPPDLVLTVHTRHEKSAEREPKHAEEVLAALDQIYGTRGALPGIAESLATPAALPAQTSWWHNYPRESSPIWGWIRPAAGTRVAIEVEWGPIRFQVNRDCGPWGIFLTCPASTYNPPVRVSFIGTDGWVDFGVGVIPSGLGRTRPAKTVGRRPKAGNPGGIPVIRTLKLVRPAGIVRLFLLNQGDKSPTVARWVDQEPDVKSAFAFFVRHDTKAPVGRRGFTDLTSASTAPLRSDAFHLTGEGWRKLREARRMSRHAVVVKALSLDQPPEVDTHSKAGLSRWEDELLRRGVEAGRRPGLPYIGTRLDTIYNAGGMTFREKVPPSRAQPTPGFKPTLLPSTLQLDRAFEIVFPRFWIGPVWLHFRSSHGRGEAFVELHWPPWCRALRVRSGTTVSTRRSFGSDDHLVVHAPVNWTVAGGMGQYSASTEDEIAIDINGDWVALSSSGREAIFGQMLPLYNSLIAHERQRAGRFLRAIPRLDRLIEARTSSSNEPSIRAVDVPGDGSGHGAIP